MAITNPLVREIAEIIIDAACLSHVNIDDLENNENLGGDSKLAMDSLDILEAVAAIEEKYKVRILDAKEGAVHFKNLETIAAFVNSQR